MHRRTFLMSTAIIGIAGCLGACSRNLKTGPTPSIAPAPTLGPDSRALPPADGAAPSSFSEFPLWPEGYSNNGDRFTQTTSVRHRPDSRAGREGLRWTMPRRRRSERTVDLGDYTRWQGKLEHNAGEDVIRPIAIVQ